MDADIPKVSVKYRLG